MKKLLNTLYIMTQGLYLRKEGETVVVEQEHKVIQRIPIHTLSGIVCFGNVLCSPFLLGFCAENKVSVSFLSEHGKFLAHSQGSTTGNILLRIAQYKAAFDQSTCLKISKNFILGKILNTRSVCQRKMRDHGQNESLSHVISFLAEITRKVRTAPDIDTLRGYEGLAGNEYFRVFNELIVCQKEDFSIQTRTRRPPLDPMNALLSFLYTLLAHDCQGAIESVGLDPQMGFLHMPRPGRPSLALDIMEEFRSPLVDCLALSLVNLKQVHSSGFICHESGAVDMKEETRKTVLLAWQKKKQEIITHPFLEEKIEIGLLPYIQAMLLARYLRGDLDAYPPFLTK